MQPQPSAPAVAPAPPSPPPPAGAPPVAVLPNGDVVLTGLPRTVEELQGLRARADLLRDQLGSALERRGELVRELEQVRLPEARAGIQQRIASIDERILQIERDQAATDRLISNASPELLAQTMEPDEHHHPNMVPEDEAILVSLFAFGGGIVVAMIAGQFRRWRARRRQPATRAGSAAAAAAAQDDPRIERLTHAVEAMAEEVERIGEGQRFVTQLLARQGEGVVLRGDAVQR